MNVIMLITVVRHLIVVFFLKKLPTVRGFELNTIIHKSVQCDHDYFHVNLMFSSIFYGVIQTENSFPRCIYIDGATEPNKAYYFKVPLKSCGSETTWDPSGSITETKNVILIQRSHGIVDQWDTSLSLLCHKDVKERTAEIATAEGKLDVAGPPEDTVLQQADLPGDAVHFSSKIVEGSNIWNPTVKGQVLLGQQLTYVFACRPSSGQIPRDCAVGECWARDPLGEVSIQLSDVNGCSKHEEFWTDFTLLSEGEEKVFTSNIWAWSFPTANSVLISCQLRVCPDACITTPCHHILADSAVEILPPSSQDDSTVDANVGAKAEPQFYQPLNGSHPQALVSFSVQREKPIITKPKSYPKHGNQEEDSDTYCISTASFATLMAVLLTTLAVLTTAVTILLCKMFHLVSRENLLYSSGRRGNDHRRRVWMS